MEGGGGRKRPRAATTPAAAAAKARREEKRIARAKDEEDVWSKRVERKWRKTLEMGGGERLPASLSSSSLI